MISIVMSARKSRRLQHAVITRQDDEYSPLVLALLRPTLLDELISTIAVSGSTTPHTLPTTEDNK